MNHWLARNRRKQIKINSVVSVNGLKMIVYRKELYGVLCRWLDTSNQIQEEWFSYEELKLEDQ